MKRGEMSFAGVTELVVEGRAGRLHAFVFDPHRLALGCWAAVTHGEPALVISLDRHFDTVPPRALPPATWTLAELDGFARTQLDGRNVDHLLAAMEAQVVSDAVLFARATPVGAVRAPSWTDSKGRAHALVSAPTVDTLTSEWGTPKATVEAQAAQRLLTGAAAVILDVDLDCFTSPSDADPTTVIPWPVELIRRHVMPRGSESFWAQVVPKLKGFTFAREPGHCGGLIASGHLFEAAAQVLFVELLGADLP